MPTLRATISTGEVVHDPTQRSLCDLVGRTAAAGDGAFLVLERCADSSGATYLQVLAGDGGFVVERRDGDRERHFRADAKASGLVARVFDSWARGTPEFASLVDWHRVQPLHWWQKWTGVAVAGGV